MTKKEKVVAAARHPDGERVSILVSHVTPYGFFGEVEPGFSALCHRSKIAGLGGRQVASVIRKGTVLDCIVFSREVTADDVRLQLAYRLDDAASARKSSECEIWIQANPDVSCRAHDWLLAQAAEAPLHASLLGKVHDLFGVPRPVWDWARTFGDFFYQTVPSGAHPVIGLKAKRNDSDYMGRVRTKLDTEPAIVVAAPLKAKMQTSSGSVTATPAHPKSERMTTTCTSTLPPQTVIVDGSNILRSPDFGSVGLVRLLEVLKFARRPPFVIFDATAPHWLRDHDDTFGQGILRDLLEKGLATVVPAGMAADDPILLLADRLGLAVVSRDRFEAFIPTYSWLADRTEQRRLHKPMVALDHLLIPSLGICAEVNKVA